MYSVSVPLSWREWVWNWIQPVVTKYVIIEDDHPHYNPFPRPEDIIDVTEALRT